MLHEQGMDDVLVTAGGIIPDDDVPALEAAGVARVFGPGTTIREVADFIRAERPRAGVNGEAVERARAGDRRALARLLTEVENRTAAGEAALRVALPARRPSPPGWRHGRAGIG